jgi:hypothetical protein
MMRYVALLSLVLAACGCGQQYVQGEHEKLALPNDCQRLDSADVYPCGSDSQGVCYKAVCVNNGMPVVYLRYKGGTGEWSKHEFYFAAKPKTAGRDAGARD